MKMLCPHLVWLAVALLFIALCRAQDHDRQDGDVDIALGDEAMKAAALNLFDDKRKYVDGKEGIRRQIDRLEELLSIEIFNTRHDESIPFDDMIDIMNLLFEIINNLEPLLPDDLAISSSSFDFPSSFTESMIMKSSSSYASSSDASSSYESASPASWSSEVSSVSSSAWSSEVTMDSSSGWSSDWSSDSNFGVTPPC